MDLLFALFFAFGTTFSIITLFTYADDVKRLSIRPLFFLLFAIAAWSLSLGALIAQSSSTTIISGYTTNAVTTNTLTNTITSDVVTTISMENSTTTSKVLPGVIYSYTPFYAAMMGIHLLLLTLFLIHWLSRETQDGLKAAKEAGFNWI